MSITGIVNIVNRRNEEGAILPIEIAFLWQLLGSGVAILRGVKNTKFYC
jgi:hypothetical protein